MKALTRWFLFVCVGLPFQGLVYVLYPLAWLYWRLFVYEEPKTGKDVALHEWHTGHTQRRSPDNMYLAGPDDHATFCMYGALDEQAMRDLLDKDGNIVRRVNEDWSLNQWQVSGDVVVSWCLSFTAPNIDQHKLEKDLLDLANVYLKNLGIQSYDDINKGHVSNRCNNFGLNYCPDSDAKGIGQPATGPQFYTSSALFALASRYSLKFKIVFWLHWILMGGWYWAFWPSLWMKDRRLVYVRDMSMRALYVHKWVFGNRWWIRKPMEWITYDTTSIRNDLWYAMMGFDPVMPLPPAMSGFFSQKDDFTSRLDDRMNGYYGSAIMELAKQARTLK